MDKTDETDKIQTAYLSLKSKIDLKPRIGIVLGSGLGDFADSLQKDAVIPYGAVKGFPVGTVSGHAGRFVFARIGDKPVLVMQGRVHYYEGYPMSDVVLPVRVMALLGVKVLFLTNAAGGINRAFRKGSLMAITDHICAAPNPLIGPNSDFLGKRFPDMTEVYDRKLSDILFAIAREENIPLQRGVYYQCTGPSFETPAEIRMMERMGADAVGMSTAVEAIAARHAGLRVAGVSAISNLAAGFGEELSHNDVTEAAKLYKDNLAKLISGFVERIEV
ncbi:purine nucleoside phosphorylase 1 [Clostridia bacterium]|nr:purine nucleoside phosphorylase 1 [Clostridia bacterium]